MWDQRGDKWVMMLIEGNPPSPTHKEIEKSEKNKLRKWALENKRVKD